MTIDVLKQSLELVSLHGGFRPAARASGIPESTLRDRHKVAVQAQGAAEEITFPDLPAADIDAETIISRAADEFTRKQRYQDAVRWLPIRVNSSLPIGVAFVGDPHLDDAGTNWPLLQEHIGILARTEGMYAVGGNDVTNNWIGRLVRLYAEQNVSQARAITLLRYVLSECGIRWLIHIMGNHDAWGDLKVIYRLLTELGSSPNVPIAPVIDWSAKFQLEFPNGRTCKIWMAHDFPGNSQWNNLHGAQKAALMGEDAHIYVCAHKHSWALAHGEHEHRGNVYWLARARGYKYIDKYAHCLGFGSHRHGATIAAVIDPDAEGAAGFVKCFAELGEAAEYLTWKRERAK
jgi:hypothetical protein